MPSPRILLDTNLYINLLLSPDPQGSSVSAILDAAAAGTAELIVPIDVIHEIGVVMLERSHLRGRVSQRDFESLIERLEKFALVVPALDVEPAAVVRDQKDVFLIALAVLHMADYLVSRDKDLLSLRQTLGIRIISPGELIALLR